MEKFLVKFNHSQASSSRNVNPSSLINDLNIDSLEADPGKRVPIAHYNPQIKDEVRKHYIQKGLVNQNGFISSNRNWKRIVNFVKFDDFFHGSTSEFYTKKGFRSWNRALERFRKHVGDVNSIHDKCFNKMLDLSNHHQSIQVVIDKHSQKLKNEYRMRLEASIDVSRLLLQYGLPFRGHDESESSINQGFFLGFFAMARDKHRMLEK
ncbi:hypothetical protein H5410_017891 [Solanum commersonii]|uniref:DUF4371 domain-containing protein n=1 Tax=Solanum commersonii TaxID=4109 RepID=A0A9J6A1B1_SOLCO|nr:hypothetical protein H5410_017891 [Solanum commersonii]